MQTIGARGSRPEREIARSSSSGRRPPRLPDPMTFRNGSLRTLANPGSRNTFRSVSGCGICRGSAITDHFASVYVPVQSNVMPSGLPFAVHVPLAFAPLSIPVPPVSVQLLLPDTVTLSFEVPVKV